MNTKTRSIKPIEQIQIWPDKSIHFCRLGRVEHCHIYKPTSSSQRRLSQLTFDREFKFHLLNDMTVMIDNTDEVKQYTESGQAMLFMILPSFLFLLVVLILVLWLAGIPITLPAFM